ncbi:hypothetical protein CR513_58034, partial [Mucuna pruriens]
MPNITSGMTLTFGDYAATKSSAVLQFCHSASGGGHYGSTRTVGKVLDCGLYWPTIFRDAHQFVSTCESFQKVGMAMN